MTINTEIVLQLIATAILIAIITKFAYPMINQYLENRANYINESIDETTKNKEQSQKELASLQTEKKEFSTKATEMEKQIRNEAIEEKNVIIGQSKEQAKVIIQKATEEINSQIADVETELMASAYDLVAEAAKLYLSKELTEEDDMILINEAISKVQSAK